MPVTSNDPKPSNKKSKKNNDIPTKQIDPLKRSKSPPIAKETINWLRCKSNTCRYDSFLTVFTLGLYSKFSQFSLSQIDKRYSFKIIMKNSVRVLILYLRILRFQKKDQIANDLW